MRRAASRAIVRRRRSEPGPTRAAGHARPIERRRRGFGGTGRPARPRRELDRGGGGNTGSSHRVPGVREVGTGRGHERATSSSDDGHRLTVPRRATPPTRSERGRDRSLPPARSGRVPRAHRDPRGDARRMGRPDRDGRRPRAAGRRVPFHRPRARPRADDGGPYAKGLHFADGYPDAWDRLVSEHPDVSAGSSNRYQAWEVPDPERWVPRGYACVRVDARGWGRSPGRIDPYAARGTKDLSTASSGLRCNAGARARSPCSASPTTRSHSGRSRAYSRRTSPRSFRGRAGATSTATCSITEASSARPWTSGTAGRRGPCSTGSATGLFEAGSPVSSSPVPRRLRRGAGDEPLRLPGRCSRAPARRRLAPRSFGALRADHGAAALIRQLGRRRQAPPGQRGGLRQLGVGTEMARDPRPRALD